MMPRLLHIMDYEPRGTRTFDHFVLRMSREFHRRGWEVCFAFGAEPPLEFCVALAEAGARHVVIAFPFSRKTARDLIRKLGNFGPDVIQTSFLSSFTLSLLNLKRRGFTRHLVVIDHSSGETPERHGWKRLLTRIRGWWVGRIVDAVLPVSEAIARRDIERVFLPAKKIRVIYNGILTDHFANPPRPEREIARVVFAGQLIPEKGIMTLLQAHLRMRKSGVRNYELLIAGMGNQEAELKAFCAEHDLGDVRFLGHIDTVPDLFGSADIVVIPSMWYEAYGLVAAEAMACGAVCIVSDAGALPEVVGPAGRVFPRGDDVALADRLRELLEAPGTRRELGAAGRQRVEQSFSLDKKIENQIAVCEEVFEGRFVCMP
jgi:glycosyltransferase involved in cell wall biosynthesis